MDHISELPYFWDVDFRERPTILSEDRSRQITITGLAPENAARLHFSGAYGATVVMLPINPWYAGSMDLDHVVDRMKPYLVGQDPTILFEDHDGSNATAPKVVTGAVAMAFGYGIEHCIVRENTDAVYTYEEKRESGLIAVELSGIRDPTNELSPPQKAMLGMLLRYALRAPFLDQSDL